MPRKFIVSIVATFAFVAVLFCLTGCGSFTSTAPVTTAASVNPEAYKITKSYGDEVWTYACEAGYIPTDVAIGDTIQRDGSSYSLKETKDASGQQESVTLTIKLADNQQIPAIIVDNVYHAKNPAGGQALYQPQLQGASTLTVTFPRAGFGGQLKTNITKVTACTKYLPATTPKG